ncbi:hypothetical protein APSETT444_007614 [Aspergillus pseudonomiae]
MLDLDDMRRRYRELNSVEDSKEKIIEPDGIQELFSQVEELRQGLTKAHDEVDNYKELAGLYKDKSSKDKEALELKNRDHFQDHLIQSGYDGGQKAVQLLRKAVEDYLFQLDPEANSRIQCRIRVYANVSGLSKTYRDTNIAPVDGTLEAFIQGFNMENGLCDFVDAGNGKECSDVKLRVYRSALFEQDILDVHCQRVIFCASADNGYARVLGPHRESDRISLVEGPSFAREMKELAPYFATTSFPDVFRNRSPVRLAVCKNAAGQRVDPPLRYSTKENVDALKQRKLCNPYHIVGSCPYGENCNHDHESRLRSQQVEDLRINKNAQFTNLHNVKFTGEAQNGYHGCKSQNMKKHIIPALVRADLEPIDGSLEKRKALASRIKAGSESTGFFYIRNHGVPEELIQNSLMQAKTFFNQPLREKMKIDFSASKVPAGYHGVGSTQVNHLKETFSMRYDPRIDPICTDPNSALEQEDQSRNDGDYIWKGTSHLPGFREVTVSFWQSRLALARKLVRIFALALGEREDYFDGVTTHPGADALYIHYPGIPDVAADSDIDVGIGSHIDIQCFTLLWQDNSGGFQVLSAQDEWLDARPIEGTLVVNIGDFLQRLLNNRFKSTVHRVYNRQPDSRYSMPFFFGFNPEAVCKVVPSCVDDEHPPLHEPISCGETRCKTSLSPGRPKFAYLVEAEKPGSMSIRAGRPIVRRRLLGLDSNRSALLLGAICKNFDLFEGQPLIIVLRFNPIFKNVVKPSTFPSKDALPTEPVTSGTKRVWSSNEVSDPTSAS